MKLKNCLLLLSALLLGKAEIKSQLKPLKISDNKRNIVYEDGSPFFYMGCTAWMLPLSLTREKTDTYLDHRSKNGYNVILVSLWIFRNSNAYGESVCTGNDPTKPNENYFKHVDYIIDKAAEKGLYVCLNPVWGNSGLGGKMGYFSTTSAKVYGEFLGNRYKNKTNVIWFIGGDTKSFVTQNKEVGKGIRNKGAAQLMTWHVDGNSSSSSVIPNSDPTIDYNMFQTGHYSRNIEPDLAITDYNKIPAKPTVNSEPNYEDHPINWNASNGHFNDHDTRKQAYWNVFSGCMGHVYGNHAIWMFYEGKVPDPFFDPPKNNVYWSSALNNPGSMDMKHIRALMESRPYLSRIPDRNIITTGKGSGSSYVAATRDENGSYAMIYIPASNQKVEIDLSKISGTKIKQWWFNPLTGSAQLIGEITNNKSKMSYTSPPNGPDWILVLDDASKNFNPPGTSIPTSDHGINYHPEFNIYPNPSKGSINIHCQGIHQKDQARFYIYDITGREIQALSVDHDLTTILISPDIKPGVYFYRFLLDNKPVAADKLLLLQDR